MRFQFKVPGGDVSRRDFLRSVALAGGLLALQRGVGASPSFALFQDSPGLKFHDPFNAEPDLARLVQSWMTPLEHFYIRSHGATPTLDPGTYRLRIVGLVERELSLSLSDLSSLYAQASGIATLQCAGNRRDEFSLVKKVGGVPWGPGAIGNASWEGVRLAELLQAAGLKDGARHVQFLALDRVEHGGTTAPFGASIPLEKAMAPETLLAYAMNGETLSPAHGFPLRAVVPGYFGVRSVKWIDTITVSAEESPNYFQQKAYKIMPPEADEKTADWTSAPPLNDMIVNSVVGTLDVDARSKTPVAHLRGYAVPTGATGDSLAQVEISPDGGKSWQTAEFSSPEMPFCWRLWEAKVPIGAHVSAFAVRATARSGATQKPEIDWNFKGYGFNAYHHRSLS